MKIILKGAEIFHGGGQTTRTKPTVTLHSFAKCPKMLFPTPTPQRDVIMFFVWISKRAVIISLCIFN